MNDQRFFFVHLQKTAGISLIERIRHHFGPEAVYPGNQDLRDDWVNALLSPEYLVERWAERGDELSVVTGHFPLCVTELLGGGFTTLTLLRDPVERTLSWLRNRRRANPQLGYPSLAEIYDDPVRFHGLVHNHMVKMFSLTSEEMTDGALTRVEFGPERLEVAKARLASVDVVGLTEDFDGFCAELARDFGWDLGDPRRENTTDPLEPPEELVRRIADDNADDIALHDFARDLVARRRSNAIAP